jgi:hypothetical protein
LPTPERVQTFVETMLRSVVRDLGGRF